MYIQYVNAIETIIDVNVQLSEPKSHHTGISLGNDWIMFVGGVN